MFWFTAHSVFTYATPRTFKLFIWRSFTTVIAIALAILYKYWTAQIQIAIDPDIAISEGVNANWQRLIFMLLLALFTVLALRAVGSLLMGALLVIPALTARLLAHSPKQMVIWAFVIA